MEGKAGGHEGSISETKGAAEHAPSGQEAATAAIQREAERLTDEARELWHDAVENMRKPQVGAMAAGAAVLAAAALWGASEAAVAAVAGYAVYRMLRKGVSLGRHKRSRSDHEGQSSEPKASRRVEAPST